MSSALEPLSNDRFGTDVLTVDTAGCRVQGAIGNIPQ